MYQTQANPAYCGLTSLAMTLNSLNVDPQRVWKGVWRWFDEELLDCCVPLHRVQKSGIALDEFACLAVCNGAMADVHRAPTSLAHNVDHLTQAQIDAFEFGDVAALTEWTNEFRCAVRRVCAGNDDVRLIVAYS